MFVDASALVAILSKEQGSQALVDRLDDAVEPSITSPLAIFETVTALCRKQSIAVHVAEAETRAFLAAASIAVVPLSDAEARAALSAFARYGKGRGHPAQLNMGDCFAYACARTHEVPMLFVGNGFAQTDIRPAMA